MSSWNDFVDEMKRMPLDTDTADRLLAGTVCPEDAPPGYARLATLLTTAADSPAAGASPRARERETVALLMSAVRSSRTTTAGSPRRSSLHRLKLATAFVIAALACTTGLAFADGLPGAAQDVASSMLAKVGITVSGPSDNAGTHPDTRGSSSSREEATTTASTSRSTSKSSAESRTEPSSGKGSAISQLATTTDLTGVEKGAAISALASDGKSQAGQHGQASSDHGSDAEAPSSSGTDKAAEASDGHSSAGSGNATGGQSHRP